jgi:3-oxoacyl-[acyl-carrier protein] reductase
VAAQKSGSSEEAAAAQRAALVPAKRFGSASEFGQTCAFLCSVHASYITGQSILMDGGLYPSTF